jgi:hypothetical protein
MFSSLLTRPKRVLLAVAAKSRRGFLKFLVTSPFYSQFPLSSQQLTPTQTHHLLSSPKEAINVMDFEGAARHALPPAHFR